MADISVADELQKADELRKRGAISQQAFDAYKAKLLGSPEVSGVSGSASPPPPRPDGAPFNGQQDEVAALRGLAPGWYRNMADPSVARYWDGTSLSEERRSVTAPAGQGLSGSSEVTGVSGSVPAPRPSPRKADESNEDGVRSQPGPGALWAETLSSTGVPPALETQPPAVAPPPSSPPPRSIGLPQEPPPLAGPPSAQAEMPSFPSVKQRSFSFRKLLIIGIVVIVLAITLVAVVVVYSGTPNTVHVKLTMSVSGTPSFPGATPVSVSIITEGAFDFNNKSASLMVVSSGTSGQGNEVIQMRIIGPTVYLSAPGLPSADGGKWWVRVGLAQYEKMEGQSESTSTLNSNTLKSEMTQVSALLRQRGKVTDLGSATIDGVATTHYRVMLPVTTTSSGSISISGTSGAKSWPADVWVDAKGRVSQLRLQIPFLGMELSEAMTLSGYDSPVSVTPPPANQTANGTPLLRNGKLKTILGGSSTNSGE